RPGSASTSAAAGRRTDGRKARAAAEGGPVERHFVLRSKLALSVPSGGTSKTSFESLLYLSGTLLTWGQPPRGGRSSVSPTWGAWASIITLCRPTHAPSCPSGPLRWYSPLAFVFPLEPGA